MKASQVDFVFEVFPQLVGVSHDGALGRIPGYVNVIDVSEVEWDGKFPVWEVFNFSDSFEGTDPGWSRFFFLAVPLIYFA